MKKIAVIIFCLLIFSTESVHAASLKFSPHHINFDAEDRVFTLTVNNDTDVKKAYRVSIETRYLNLNGSQDIVGNDAALSAVPYLRLSPRRIMLEAFGKQEIRLQYAGEDIPDGDYLAHLTFKKVDIPTLRSTENIQNNQAEALDIEVEKAFNSAIPIRLSVGDVTRNIQILAAEKITQDNKEFLDVQLTRDGNGNGIGFLYGYFKSNDITGETNSEFPMVLSNVPVNIYRNLNSFTIRAPILTDFSLNNGKLILMLHDGEGANRPILDIFILEIE